jgi:hypothetical protein
MKELLTPSCTLSSVPPPLTQILAPSLNLLLRLQLELSVKAMSVMNPTPPVNLISTSPESSGLFPSLSRTILSVNSASVHELLSSLLKSPSSTTISTLAEERGEEVTTWFTAASVRQICIGWLFCVFMGLLVKSV